MAIEENTWAFFGQMLGYNEEELALFKSNPRNEKIISRAGVLAGIEFTAEVVESHGCFSRHKVGDRIVLDGAGNLLTARCPERMCVYLMQSLGTAVFASQELVYAGVDPAELAFRRFGCLDVGLRRGGWGRVVMELRANRPEERTGS